MSKKEYLKIQSREEIFQCKNTQNDAIVIKDNTREKVIQALRQIPAFLDSVKKLSEGKKYQAYFPPEVLARITKGSAILDKKDNGLFGALIRDIETGQVTNHVNLKEVTPDLICSLNQLAIQQTLADIVQRLDIIDENITEILQGQANDRLAEIESGIHIYEQAEVATDFEVKRELIVSAIQKLNEGRNKLIKSTTFNFLVDLKRDRLGMFFSKYGDIPKFVQSNAESACKAALAIIKASRYLVIAYSALNQPDSLRVSLVQVKSEVKDFQDKLVEIVRWLPPTSNLCEPLTIISQGVLPDICDLDDIPNKTIVIEFQPKEIAPPEGVCS